MKDDQIFQQKQAQPSPTSTNVNESQPPSHAAEIPLGGVKQSPSQELAKGEQIDQPSIHKSTGPLTPRGKQVSKYNSLKHGLFSSAVLLKGESHRDYNSLLNGLRDTLHPEGRLEEVMVESLATLLWRMRRVLQAENAEISENIDAIDMINEIDNPLVLNRRLQLLEELWKGIQNRGFNREQDGSLLRAIYGDPERHHLRQTLQDEYSIWLDTACLAEEVRTAQKSAPPEECKLKVLQSILAEIKRLEKYKNKPESRESERTKMEIFRQSVVASRGMDLFLRHETHLSREIDRIMNRIERLQRMRKGQPPPPQVEVKIS
jgi:hypothetical protein